MFTFQAWRAVATAISCALALTGCGGGGGGSAVDDSGAPPVDTSAVTIGADRSALDFGGFVRGETNTEVIHFTLSGMTSTVYVGIDTSRRDFFAEPQFVIDGPNTSTVSITPSNAAAGQGSGDFVFSVCADAQCAHVLATKHIPYALAVYDAHTDVSAESAYAGAPAGDLDVSVSPPALPGDFILASDQGGAPATWLSAAVTGGDLHIAATGVGLVPGNYAGSVTLALARHPELAQRFPLALAVSSGTLAPQPVSLVLDAANTAATTAQLVQVGFEPGVAPAWHVESDQPWLVLTQPAAAGAGSFGVRVDSSALGAMANWSTRSANVTVHADGQLDFVVPVTLAMQLPQVTSVSPRTVPTGATATLHVFGRGLEQPGALAGLAIEGATVTSRTLNSDTLATLVVAAMPAGAHAVTAANATSHPVAAGRVTALAPTASAYAFVPDTGDKRSAIFDGPRNAVFAVGFENYFLIRYEQSGGSWHVDRLPVPLVDELAMSRDESTLVVTSGTSTVLLVDPDTLTVRQKLTAPFDVTADSGRRMPAMATADDRVWLGDGGGYYDMASGQFGVDADVAAFMSLQESAGTPDDGSALYLGQPSTTVNHVYSAATQQVAVSAGMPAVYATLSFSNDLSRRIVDNYTVYDGSWNVLGNAMEAGAQYSGYASVVSPDGRRVYALFADGSSSGRHVAVFDSSVLAAGSARLVEVGTIPIADRAVCTAFQQQQGWCDVEGALMIDPAGQTLYWVGGQGLVVLPIPADLSGQQASMLRTQHRPAH